MGLTLGGVLRLSDGLLALGTGSAGLAPGALFRNTELPVTTYSIDAGWLAWVTLAGNGCTIGASLIRLMATRIVLESGCGRRLDVIIRLCELCLGFGARLCLELFCVFDRLTV